jgi:hypothetical protein
MKKIALFSFMVVAVLGMMTSRAQGGGDWSVSITIANSAEIPVMLSLESNDQAKARFPNNSTSWTLQPGQSTVVMAERSDSPPGSLEWNIIYNFYDGTTINQRVSSKFGPHADGVRQLLPIRSVQCISGIVC